MSLNFGPSPKSWRHPGHTIDFSADPTTAAPGAAGRDKRAALADQRWGTFNEAERGPAPHAHALYSDWDSGGGQLNRDIESNAVKPGVAAILSRYGWTPGQKLSHIDTLDLDWIVGDSGTTIASELQQAQDAGAVLNPPTPAPTPTPTPKPTPKPVPAPTPPSTGAGGAVGTARAELLAAKAAIERALVALDGAAKGGVFIGGQSPPD